MKLNQELKALYGYLCLRENTFTAEVKKNASQEQICTMDNMLDK